MISPFWKTAEKAAVVFVDYEYWYASMQRMYRVLPDINTWIERLRKEYRLKNVYFFANFQMDSLKNEVPKIRQVTNNIIETQSSFNGSYMKDMSDFVILDFIYRAAFEKKAPQNFIIFTGDGHFQSVVNFLANELKKNVTVYGIKDSFSHLLKTVATKCVELPDNEAEQKLCYELIVKEFDEISERYSDVVITFRSLSERISTRYHVLRQEVEIALSDMIERGLVRKKKHAVSFGDGNINVVVPEWDKLIEAGLYTPKE